MGSLAGEMPKFAQDKEPEETDAMKTKEEHTEEGEEHERGSWTGKLDFIMSALSFAVGMGNLWRFPYLCYRNGGGAFLIPYIVMMVFAGTPIMFLEFSFGQFASQGVVSIWKACPLFQGIGWTMFLISTISCIYYNMLVAYSFFYTYASFASDVPWRECGNSWNTEACRSVANMLSIKNCTAENGTWFNGTCHLESVLGVNAYSQLVDLANVTAQNAPKPLSASDEYFHKYMLDISEGIEDLGGVRWQLAMCLLLCWVIVFLGLSTGVKSLGKATYVTSLLPYIILVILFIRGITLDGATSGIHYYLVPRWSQLLSAKVWGDAAVQVFFSMSTCWGGLITLASYNKFNNNCLRDAIIVALGDGLTSLFAGIVIFSIIGYMAHDLGVHVSEVATQGAGLAYIVYPQVVTMLPVSPLWAILFMLMLVNLGIGTQFTLVTTSHTTICDNFPNVFRKGRRALLLLAVMCSAGFLIGLIFTTRGGMYVLQLMDSYAPSYALLTVGLSEMIALGWVYGADRFMKNIEQMLGKKPSRFFFACWKFITPLLIIAILLFTFIDFKRSSYGDYQYPLWADIIGWFIAVVEIACIPGVAIYKLVTYEEGGSFMQRLRGVTTPTEDWGPAKEVRRKQKQQLAEWKMPLTRAKKENEDDLPV